MTPNTKTCLKCGAEKPLADFYKHKHMADGHLNKCKACAKNDSTKHRNFNLEKVRAYDRRRGFREKDPKRIKARNAARSMARPANCTWCNSEENIEAHHPDYDKPKEVIWLCRTCHRNHHAE